MPTRSGVATRPSRPSLSAGRKGALPCRDISPEALKSLKQMCDVSPSPTNLNGQCKHHWILPPPSEEHLSDGEYIVYPSTCKLCGQEKEMRVKVIATYIGYNNTPLSERHYARDDSLP